MVSLIIPTYKNPEYLDLCIKSALGTQELETNEVIVVVDGFVEMSRPILDKYKDHIKILPLPQNQGMQQALNFGVMNATNEIIFIINDDNVLGTAWDTTILNELHKGQCLTLNQVEPDGPSIFGFDIKDLGKTPKEFDFDKWLDYEVSIKEPFITPDGGIFPFAMWKKDYMIVGGFDTLYKSPFICDWDFFLKLELNKISFKRTRECHLYHFGSASTKNRTDGDQVIFRASEQAAAQMFEYKWGFKPQLFENNSHKPKTQTTIKGIFYEKY